MSLKYSPTRSKGSIAAYFSSTFGFTEYTWQPVEPVQVIHQTFIVGQIGIREHEMLMQCWCNDGPPSTTLAQHYTSIESASGVHCANNHTDNRLARQDQLE